MQLNVRNKSAAAECYIRTEVCLEGCNKYFWSIQLLINKLYLGLTSYKCFLMLYLWMECTILFWVLNEVLVSKKVLTSWNVICEFEVTTNSFYRIGRKIYLTISVIMWKYDLLLQFSTKGFFWLFYFLLLDGKGHLVSCGRVVDEEVYDC